MQLLPVAYYGIIMVVGTLCCREKEFEESYQTTEQSRISLCILSVFHVVLFAYFDFVLI